MKRVRFLGDSKNVISAFPKPVRRKIGFQIERLQSGRDPHDWKPMSAVGSGVREIRVRDATGAYRIASLPSAVYILHAFDKKTRATPKHDIDTAASRFRELLRSLNS